MMMAMKRGMTLVELLIVVGIIAIVAGLSMAVIFRVRQRAYLAVCINNLRQLVQAVHMYEQDWGTVPIERPTETPEGIYGRVHQMIYPYVKNDAVYLCPADFTGGRMSYAEDAHGRPAPYDPNPWAVTWQGKEWLMSYIYCINDLVVEEYGKGSTKLKFESPLFICDWHAPHYRAMVIARYGGTVEIVSPGLYKSIHALFEGID